jgi:hypothetical protein
MNEDAQLLEMIRALDSTAQPLQPILDSGSQNESRGVAAVEPGCVIKDGQQVFADAVNEPPSNPFAFAQAQAGAANRYSDLASAAAALTNKYIYIRAVNSYLEKATGLLVSPEAFDADEAARMPLIGSKVINGVAVGGTRPKATKVFNESSSKTTCHDRGYHPGKSLLYLGTDGVQQLANSYQPPSYELLTPTDEERALWEAFLAHLFPDWKTNIGLQLHLDGMAYLLANPGERLRYMTVLSGRAKGSGKTTLMDTITRLLFGASNHRQVTRSEWQSRFIDYLFGCRIVSIEEMFEGDPEEAEERTNMRATYITSPVIAGDMKGVKGKQFENVVSMMGTSNYPDRCVFIPTDDRRYLMLETSAKEMPEWLKEKFVADFLGSARAAGVLASLLLARDVSKFNPHKRPPLTQTKKIAQIAQHLNEVQREILAAFTDHDRPFNKEFGTLNDVREALKLRGIRDPQIPGNQTLGIWLRKAFEVIGHDACRMESRARVGNEYPRFWAWKNTTKWQNAAETEIREHLESNIRAADEETVAALRQEARAADSHADRVNKLIEQGKQAEKDARRKLRGSEGGE